MKASTRLSSIIVIFLLLFCTAFSAGDGNALTRADTRIQPILQTIANQDPGNLVSVIVQKLPGAQGLEAKVQRLGGRLTADLGMINAFAAELPASAAVELSTDPAVRWVSLNAQMQSTWCSQCIDTTNLANAYIGTIKASNVWNTAPYLQGQGIGVAVIDSGVNPNGDLYTLMGVNREIDSVRFNSDYNQSVYDGYGHGTHVAGVIAGDGSESQGKYIGVAPMANIINVKVSNDDGSARISDVVAGMQWVLEHKTADNIRVVNLSLNSAVPENYNTSPLDAAAEILWFNGIVVVASAGNAGSNAIYPPANDPFVITVGAIDDKGTASRSDDVMASFSAYGVAGNGVRKPDLVAPGKNIVARIVNMNMGLAGAHPDHIVNSQYFSMSGTSVSAPMVSGAVAILLQDEPNLTPDQVKYRLMATAYKNWPGYDSTKAGAGILNVNAAVLGTTTNSSNTGYKASALLTTGSQPITWNSVGWNSVGWNSVGWNSVGWNSVGWNSVGWNSDYWGQ